MRTLDLSAVRVTRVITLDPRTGAVTSSWTRRS